MPLLVFLDNTVLSNFALVNRLDVLYELWKNNACVPMEVLREYEVGVQGLHLSLELLRIVHLTVEEQSYAQRLSSRLGAGERACIAACFYQDGLFASDDRDARMLAKRVEIPVLGTLGILIRCIQKGVLPIEEAQKLLEGMIARGYRSPVLNILELL